MFSIGNRQVIIFWLILTLGTVFASLNDENNTMESSAEMMFSYLRLPWIEGIEWLVHSNESSVREVRAMIKDVESGETWALEMLDRLLKSQREIRETNIEDLDVSGGNIERIVQDNYTNTQDDRCMISLDTVFSILNETDSFSSSACYPSSNETRTAQFFSNVISSDLQTSDSRAGANTESKAFTVEEIYAIFFFSTVCTFMLVCTICDFRKRFRPRNTSNTVDMLAKFSLYSNALALLDLKVTPRTIPAIHGIRFLSFLSVIIGHRNLAMILLRKDKISVLDILEWKRSWVSLYIQSTVFMVDTFSVVSGFLTAYLFFRSMKSGIKFNLLAMYLHRYLRLTPCLAVLMLYFVTLFHRAESGPAWDSSVQYIVNSCRQNWWSNLLYIQNFASEGGMCLPHSWYLAVDMQLFFISPIILYPLYRWPTLGLGILISMLIASVTVPPIFVVIEGYFHAVLRLDVDLLSYAGNFSSYYSVTFNRAVPYLVGILLGHEISVKKRHLTQVNVAINWIAAGSIALFCVWANYHVNNSDFAYNLPFECAFALLERLFWSFAVAWMIYACTQGYGGLATRLLSMPFFLPLSRLSYCIYLVHVLVQTKLVTASSSQSTDLFLRIFNGIWGDLLFSTVAAFVLTLFFGTPISILEEIIAKQYHRRIKQSVSAVQVKKQK